MEFNNMISSETQQQLQIIETLSRSGVIRIGKTGSEIKKILFQLKHLNVQLTDEDQTTIQTFSAKFQNLIRHHKEYIGFNRSIAHLHIEEQINLLTEKFTLLDEEANQLKHLTHDFLLQKRFETQQGQLVSLPQQQPEIESEAREHVIEQPGIESEAREHVIEQPEIESEAREHVVDNVDLGRQTTIWELSVPLEINSIKRLQSETFSKWIGTFEPELQVHYLKTSTGNQFFIGINCNLNLNFSNFKKFKYQKSHFVRFRTLNSIMKIYHFHNNNNSKLTLSFGRILKMKNEQINVFTNFALNNTSFKKENLSFELEYKSRFYNITGKHQSHLTFQHTTCYEFFPYKNNFMSDFENLTKKTKNLSTTNKTLNLIKTQASDADTIVNQPSNCSKIENSAVTADLVIQEKIGKKKHSSSKYNQFASVSLAPPLARTNLDSLVFCALGLALGVVFFNIRKFFVKQTP